MKKQGESSIMPSRTRGLIRQISAVLVIAFASEQIAFANPDLKPVQIDLFAKPEVNFSFPASVTTIEDAYKVPDVIARRSDSDDEAISKTKIASGAAHPRNDKLTVILIQDAHVNDSGQINLAKALDVILEKEKNLKYVFVEAGVGDTSLSFLKNYSSFEDRKRVGMSFLRKGVLHGEEYLNMTSDRSFTLWGVEDISLYLKALEAYRYTANQREKFGSYLDKIETTIKVLKPRIYSPWLLSFDESHERFLKNEIPLTDFFEVLAKQAQKRNIPLSSFPHLKRLKQLKEQEARLDFKLANEEQAKAITELSEADQKELIELSRSQNLSKIALSDNGAQKGFYTLLEEKLAHRCHPEVAVATEGSKSEILRPFGTQNDKKEVYPNLRKYFRYLKAASKIKPEEILKEEKTIEDLVFYAMARTPDEVNLMRASKALKYLRKLFSLTMTPEEFREYKSLTVGDPSTPSLGSVAQDDASRRFDIVALTAFLNRKIMDLKSFYENTVFLEKGFDEIVKNAESFYTITIDRDRAFVENMLKKLDEGVILSEAKDPSKRSFVANAPQDDTQTAVLITGGYHTVNLKNLLKAKGISYIVVRPQVYAETNQKKYEKVLLGQKLDLERINRTLSNAPKLSSPAQSLARPWQIDQVGTPDARQLFVSLAFNPERLSGGMNGVVGGDGIGGRPNPPVIASPLQAGEAIPSEEKPGARMAGDKNRIVDIGLGMVEKANPRFNILNLQSASKAPFSGARLVKAGDNYDGNANFIKTPVATDGFNGARAAAASDQFTWHDLTLGDQAGEVETLVQTTKDRLDRVARFIENVQEAVEFEKPNWFMRLVTAWSYHVSLLEDGLSRTHNLIRYADGTLAGIESEFLPLSGSLSRAKKLDLNSKLMRLRAQITFVDFAISGILREYSLVGKYESVHFRMKLIPQDVSTQLFNLALSLQASQDWIEDVTFRHGVQSVTSINAPVVSSAAGTQSEGPPQTKVLERGVIYGGGLTALRSFRKAIAETLRDGDRLTIWTLSGRTPIVMYFKRLTGGFYEHGTQITAGDIVGVPGDDLSSLAAGLRERSVPIIGIDELRYERMGARMAEILKEGINGYGDVDQNRLWPRIALGLQLLLRSFPLGVVSVVWMNPNPRDDQNDAENPYRHPPSKRKAFEKITGKPQSYKRLTQIGDGLGYKLNFFISYLLLHPIQPYHAQVALSRATAGARAAGADVVGEGSPSFWRATNTTPQVMAPDKETSGSSSPAAQGARAATQDPNVLFWRTHFNAPFTKRQESIISLALPKEINDPLRSQVAQSITEIIVEHYAGKQTPSVEAIIDFVQYYFGEISLRSSLAYGGVLASLVALFISYPVLPFGIFSLCSVAGFLTYLAINKTKIYEANRRLDGFKVDLERFKRDLLIYLDNPAQTGARGAKVDDQAVRQTSLPRDLADRYVTRIGSALFRSGSSRYEENLKKLHHEGKLGTFGDLLDDLKAVKASVLDTANRGMAIGVGRHLQRDLYEAARGLGALEYEMKMVASQINGQKAPTLDELVTDLNARQTDNNARYAIARFIGYLLDQDKGVIPAQRHFTGLTKALNRSGNTNDTLWEIANKAETILERSPKILPDENHLADLIRVLKNPWSLPDTYRTVVTYDLIPTFLGRRPELLTDAVSALDKTSLSDRVVEEIAYSIHRFLSNVDSSKVKPTSLHLKRLERASKRIEGEAYWTNEAIKDIHRLNPELQERARADARLGTASAIKASADFSSATPRGARAALGKAVIDEPPHFLVHDRLSKDLEYVSGDRDGILLDFIYHGESPAKFSALLPLILEKAEKVRQVSTSRDSIESVAIEGETPLYSSANILSDKVEIKKGHLITVRFAPTGARAAEDRFEKKYFLLTGSKQLSSEISEADLNRLITNQTNRIEQYLRKGVTAYVDEVRKRGLKISASTVDNTVNSVMEWLTSPSIDKYTKLGLLRAIANKRFNDITMAHNDMVMFGTAGPRQFMVFNMTEAKELKEKGFKAEILKGPKTMNNITFMRLAMGSARYFKKKAEQAGHKPVMALAYDSRIQNPAFADAVAASFLREGFEVKLFDLPSATPFLSFGASFVKADVGILLSASHNDYRFGGFKVFDGDGSQLGPSDRARVIEHTYGTRDKHNKLADPATQGYIPPVELKDVQDILSASVALNNLDATDESNPYHSATLKKNLYRGPLVSQYSKENPRSVTILGEVNDEGNVNTPRQVDLVTPYVRHIIGQMMDPDMVRKAAPDIRLLYMAFYGVGERIFLRILSELGFDRKNIIIAQEVARMDGLFPVFSEVVDEEGNPEIPDPGNSTGKARLAQLAIARHVQDSGNPFNAFTVDGKPIDIAIGTDPDADRMGANVPVPQQEVPQSAAEGEAMLFSHVLPQDQVSHIGFTALRLLAANLAWAVITKYQIDEIAKKIRDGAISPDTQFTIIKSHVTTDQLKALVAYAKAKGEEYGFDFKVEVVETYVGFGLLAEYGKKGWEEGKVNISADEESGGTSKFGAPTPFYLIMRQFQQVDGLELGIEQGRVTSNHPVSSLLTTDRDKHFHYLQKVLENELRLLETHGVLIRGENGRYSLAPAYAVNRGSDHDTFWRPLRPMATMTPDINDIDPETGFVPYLMGNLGHTLDKDGPMAGILLLEVLAYAKTQGMTLNEYIQKELLLNPWIGLFGDTNQFARFTNNDEGTAIKYDWLRTALEMAVNFAKGGELSVDITLDGGTVKKKVVGLKIFIPAEQKYKTSDIQANFPVDEYYDVLGRYLNEDKWRQSRADMHNFFPEEGIRFYFEGGKMDEEGGKEGYDYITIRPSGTEPKIRFYVQNHPVEVSGQPISANNLSEAQRLAALEPVAIADAFKRQIGDAVQVKMTARSTAATAPKAGARAAGADVVGEGSPSFWRATNTTPQVMAPDKETSGSSSPAAQGARAATVQQFIQRPLEDQIEELRQSAEQGFLGYRPVQRILVSDDDPNIRLMMSELLQVHFEGMEVVTVARSEDAVAEIQRAKEEGNPFDAAIADHNTNSEKSGVDLMLEIRAWEADHQVSVPDRLTIILQTGNSFAAADDFVKHGVTSSDQLRKLGGPKTAYAEKPTDIALLAVFIRLATGSGARAGARLSKIMRVQNSTHFSVGGKIDVDVAIDFKQRTLNLFIKTDNGVLNRFFGFKDREPQDISEGVSVKLVRVDEKKKVGVLEIITGAQLGERRETVDGKRAWRKTQGPADIAVAQGDVFRDTKNNQVFVVRSADYDNVSLNRVQVRGLSYEGPGEIQMRQVDFSNAVREGQLVNINEEAYGFYAGLRDAKDFWDQTRKPQGPEKVSVRVLLDKGGRFRSVRPITGKIRRIDRAIFIHLLSNGRLDLEYNGEEVGDSIAPLIVVVNRINEEGGVEFPKPAVRVEKLVASRPVIEEPKDMLSSDLALPQLQREITSFVKPAKEYARSRPGVKMVVFFDRVETPFANNASSNEIIDSIVKFIQSRPGNVYKIESSENKITLTLQNPAGARLATKTMGSRLGGVEMLPIGVDATPVPPTVIPGRLEGIAVDSQLTDAVAALEKRGGPTARLLELAAGLEHPNLSDRLRTPVWHDLIAQEVTEFILSILTDQTSVHVKDLIAHDVALLLESKEDRLIPQILSARSDREDELTISVAGRDVVIPHLTEQLRQYRQTAKPANKETLRARVNQRALDEAVARIAEVLFVQDSSPRDGYPTQSIVDLSGQYSDQAEFVGAFEDLLTLIQWNLHANYYLDLSGIDSLDTARKGYVNARVKEFQALLKQDPNHTGIFTTQKPEAVLIKVKYVDDTLTVKDLPSIDPASERVVFAHRPIMGVLNLGAYATQVELSMVYGRHTTDLGKIPLRSDKEAFGNVIEALNGSSVRKLIRLTAYGRDGRSFDAGVADDVFSVSVKPDVILSWAFQELPRISDNLTEQFRHMFQTLIAA